MTKNFTCKNTICVNNKTIKLGTMKARKISQLQRYEKRQKSTNRKKSRKQWSNSNFLKERIYFYNIDENVSYKTDKKSTWEHNKDKRGFLYLVSYKNFIYEHKPGTFFNRMRGPSIMIFSKTDEQEIKDDPQWAYSSGITMKKPYAFGLSANHLSHKSDSKFTEQTTDKPITKNTKLSMSDFNKFIKNVEDMLQTKNLLKEFEFSDPYIANYSDLLHTFYKKSSFGDSSIFGIVKWA